MNRIIILLLVVVVSVFAQSKKVSEQPNIVLIFVDDMGYGDIGCFGSKEIETPNLDQMAKEGMKFTNFYAASVCGPSRAQLMTGSYHGRIDGSHNELPKSKHGLHLNEITVAEVLKDAGYKTYHVGKWHLGDAPKFLPHKQGFDEFWGYPYSHDMWPFHSASVLEHVQDDPRFLAQKKRAKEMKYKVNRRWKFPDLPLMHNDSVIEYNPKQSVMTRRFTEKAIEYIKQSKEQPFFLYLAHPMPHTPLFASEKFAGKSKRGLYGDAVMEVDWSYGEIVKTLKKLKIDDNTLIVFTSDNGPTTHYGRDGGSTGGLRGGKSTTFEGGSRVPCLMRWLGHIKANQENPQLISTIDFLPTFAKLGNGKIPTDRVLDGVDIQTMFQDITVAKHEYLHYFGMKAIGKRPSYKAIRNKTYKLFFNEKNGAFTPLQLYNLEQDIAESKNIAKQQPKVVKELLTEAKLFFTELMDNTRPVGVVEGGGTTKKNKKNKKKGKGKKKKKH